MLNKYTTSINIERDFDKDLKYIPTANAKSIFNQLVNSFQSGLHSFNIIGSYGTGKSSFILAFEKNLNNNIEYFAKINGQFNGLKEFVFVNIVGEYTSLEETINNKLNKKKGRKKTLQVLKEFYLELAKENKFLVFVIDEFGKFLEYASNNNPEKELYFIQELAEFINDTSKNTILITTLHQDFSTYSNSLNINQRKEWDKVKGRFKELAFNEPIEQLLFLAAEFIEGDKKIENTKKFKELFQLVKDANIVTLSESIDFKIAKKLYPLDLLSASILTLALQRYGQNERSLFSFLQSDDENSIKIINGEDNYFNLNHVFNYLINNFYSVLNTPILNPDERQWASIRDSIEKVEGFWSENIENAVKVVKSIGLLNIFSTYKSSVSREFLASYAESCLKISDSKDLIDELERRKIIRYAAYRSQYILVSGTDMDINKEIEEAGAYVDKNTDTIQRLKQHIEFPYIPAKAIQYEVGIPRFFEFVISKNPMNLTPTGEIDGYIELIFNEDISETEISEISKNQEEAILYALFKKPSAINDLLFLIEKLNYVIKNTDSDDRVALKELNKQKAYEIQRLKDYIINSVYGNKEILWFYKGAEIQISNKTNFNKLLSEVCREVYNKTAIYKNESVNKHRLSPTISTARKNFLNALLNNWEKENLNIEKFPPEKAVYLTLLKNTGIHKSKNDSWYFDKPEKGSGLNELWDICEEFIESAKNRKKNLVELVELLSAKPYKLKQGFIDYWLPIFLFIKREDFALFYGNSYVPFITIEITDLMYRSIKDFSIKTFSIDGPKLELFNEYRRLINLEDKEKASQKSLVETIKPFLVFYKQLPDYTKQTKSLSRNATRLREAIAKAKEPVETFFDDFPKAMGFKDLDFRKNDELLPDFLKYFKEAIKELRTCLNDYIDKIELLIINEFGLRNASFIDYKESIAKRYKSIKVGLLPSKTKVFLNRLCSPIDNRNAWFESLAQVLMDKKIEKIRDEEKNILAEKFIDAFRELDALIPVHKAKKENPKDQIIKFDIVTEKGKKTNQLIIANNKKKDVEDLEVKLLSLLKGEKDELIQKAAIINILQKKIK